MQRSLVIKFSYPNFRVGDVTKQRTHQAACISNKVQSCILFALVVSCSPFDCVAFQDFYELANQRIEQHRKTEIDITVVDSNGQAVAGADVEVNMTKHGLNSIHLAQSHR